MDLDVEESLLPSLPHFFYPSFFPLHLPTQLSQRAISKNVCRILFRGRDCVLLWKQLFASQVLPHRGWHVFPVADVHWRLVCGARHTAPCPILLSRNMFYSPSIPLSLLVFTTPCVTSIEGIAGARECI